MRRPVSSHFVLGIARMPLHWGAGRTAKIPQEKASPPFLRSLKLLHAGTCHVQDPRRRSRPVMR